jgi:hypothetical protein
MQRFKPVVLVIGALFASGAFAGTAAAVLASSSGGPQQRIDTRTDDSASSTNSSTFIDVPGMNVDVVVPANQSRLVEAPFYAESRCDGNQTGRCAVRIIATNLANGGSVELGPASGSDYSFDTDTAAAADDGEEGHAMSRSRRLSGGANGVTYRIRVQFAVANANTQFRLDDKHLTVNTHL